MVVTASTVGYEYLLEIIPHTLAFLVPTLHYKCIYQLVIFILFLNNVWFMQTSLVHYLIWCFFGPLANVVLIVTFVVESIEVRFHEYGYCNPFKA